MFTVKHRAADGMETLYSAEMIEVVYPRIFTADDERANAVNKAGATNIYDCGIFLDRDPVSHAPGEPVTRFSKQIIQFGHDATMSGQERKGGKVWVMNEAGATVATYDL